MQIKERIRGYLPVVIDIETAGFNHQTDAMLEICAVIIGIDDNGKLYPKEPQHFLHADVEFRACAWLSFLILRHPASRPSRPCTEPQ